MKYLFLIFTLHASLCFGQTTLKTIVAEGNAKTRVKPDIALISLSIEKNDTSEALVMQQLNQEVEQLANMLEKQGFTKKQIKIADYSISSSFDSEKKKREYTAANSLTVEIHAQEQVINLILTTIEAEKLSDLDISFDYKLSDSLEKATRKLLVQQAIANAQANANNISQALKIELKRIRQVSKNGSPFLYADTKIEYTKFTPPVVVEKLMDTKIGSAFQNFEVTEIDLSEEITIVYEI